MDTTFEKQYAAGYLAKNATGELFMSTWTGEYLGTAKITATWKTPRSYVSSTYHQVESTIQGVTYTGRSAGVCMLWKGKRKGKKA